MRDLLLFINSADFLYNIYFDANVKRNCALPSTPVSTLPVANAFLMLCRNDEIDPENWGTMGVFIGEIWTHMPPVAPSDWMATGPLPPTTWVALRNGY